MVRISEKLGIDDSEIRFEFTRSSGPGGQNVNKVETKVRLLFDVAGSSLSADQKRRITERLGSRISKDGVLRVSSQRHRTREANRAAAVERFAELIAGALKEDVPRIATKVPRAQKKRRLVNKKRHARKKALRATPEDDV
jgi:ribosome-associated protein